MRSLVGLTLSFGFLVTGTTAAQQTVDSHPSSVAQVASQTPDRSSIDPVLRQYEAAYNHQNVDELLVVWPRLQNDKKSLKKIKDEFGRADISDVNVSLQVQEVQAAADGETLVRCVRSEQYKKLETTGVSPGDLGIQQVPRQIGGASSQTEKKQVHKTTGVWLMLYKTGNEWAIASVSDKKPH